MYRPSVNTPQTAWGRHLDKVMRDNDWSRVRLFEEVGAELGYSPKSRSALLPLLINKEPDERQAAILRKHFGEPTPLTEPEQEPVEADLIRAIGDLVRQVEAERAERRRWELGWISTLRAALAGQVPAELLDALVPLPPEGTQP